MRLTFSTLAITLFILIASAHSHPFFSSFLEGFKKYNDFNIQSDSEDSACIDKGAQIINSSLQLLNNYHNQSFESLLLDALNLYQQSEETLSQCNATFKVLASNFSQNHERMRNNLNNYFPRIIQDLGVFIFPFDSKLQSGSFFYSILHMIFGEVGPTIPVRKFYSPKKTVEFEPERFYDEFIPSLLNRLFRGLVNETITKGVGKCMSKNAYIVHNPMKEENILETLMNIPYWIEEIENCLHSENADITFLKNFLNSL